jgi:hypothetical protein
MYQIKIQLTAAQEQLIREGIDRLVKPEARPLAQRWERAGTLVGKYRTSPAANAAADHDEYFSISLTDSKGPA